MDDPVYYCKGCGIPIFSTWVVDVRSDREYPNYYHFGCLYPKEENEENEQPSHPTKDR